jgi:hypothetical protein
MTLDVTAADAVLRETYADGIISIDYQRAKTLALLKKTKGVIKPSPFGAGFVQPLKYGNPQAISGTYADGYAEAETENSRYENWFLRPGQLFGFARVAGQLTREGDGIGSFIDPMVSEIENVKTGMTRLCEIMLGSNGWGSLGQIDQTATSVSTTTLTLKEKWMSRFFEPGMSLVASSAETGATLRSATAIKVTKVNNGVLTMASAGNTQSWAVGDYLFPKGNRHNSASTVRIVPCGFAAFQPSTDPTSGQTLFNVDQSLSPRTGGNRRSALTSSGTVEEALLDLSTDIDTQGGVTTHCVLGTNTYGKLIKSMLNKTYFDVEDIDGKPLGFRGVMLAGASGDMLCYADSSFPEGVAYQFGLDDVGILHTGKDMIYIEEKDGLMFREVPGTDDWQSRLVSSWQFYNDAPGHAGVCYDL